MMQYRWYFLLLIALVFSCKTPQPNMGGDKDLSGKEDTGKKNPVVKKAGVDADLAKFRITYDVANSYETFATPKTIKKVETSSTIDKTLPITSSDHINKSLDDKLSQIRYMNGDVDKVMGYRILIYSGNDIGKAKNLQSDLRIVLSGTGYATKISYNPPNYTLKAGRFLSKLKAHELYAQLKEEFPQAVLITEDIDFNPSYYIINE